MNPKNCDCLGGNKFFNPKFIAKGADYENCDIVGAEIVKRNGGNVLFAPVEYDISTSPSISTLTFFLS